MENKKLSSYQKLKAERHRLLQEISVLVRKPDSVEALDIKMRYVIRFEQEDLIWSGKSNYIRGIDNKKENLIPVGKGLFHKTEPQRDGK